MTEQTKRAVDTMRAISIDAIANASSGHSGVALGAAPALYSVYNTLKIDTEHPNFFNRDRFVLGAGHGSSLLYTTLHLFGFDVTIDDLKKFRRIHSKTPGHPEIYTPGVDCATGPLGQGLATSVGMALAEKRLAATYNKDGLNVIDHWTFCVAGDGCMMEGVSHEACNLAGVWKLNKLIVLYDSNDINLEGRVENVFRMDARKRFEAMGWNVLEVADGQNADDITAAINTAKKSTDNPTLIIVKSQIGYGSKIAGTSKAHGAVLTKEECAEIRKAWKLDPEPFTIDIDVKRHFEGLASKKRNAQKQWQKELEKYKAKYPKEYSELSKFWENPKTIFSVTPEGKDASTRDSGHFALQQIAKQSARVMGANADISSTTKAFIKDGGIFSAENPTGTDLACGDCEFAMAAITSGLALHGYTPYCSTFLCFSDYVKPAMRVAAIMKLPVTYFFSHDGLGNTPDGPTHQGGEHIAALRLVPDVKTFRPADDIETAASYKWLYENNSSPACVLLSRSPNPRLANSSEAGVQKGGYIISNCDKPDAVLLSSGAEVDLCLSAQKLLEKSGIAVRVVSMPCLELFDAQTDKYKAAVLGDVPAISVEMGAGSPWYKYIGKNGTVVSFDRFGKSGTTKEVMDELGFTAENIAKIVLETIKR